MGKGKRIKGARQGREDFIAYANAVATRHFQREIRESELWPQMVAAFGEKGAEDMLRQCRGELRLGGPSEGGGRPEGIPGSFSAD